MEITLVCNAYEILHSELLLNLNPYIKLTLYKHFYIRI